METKLEMPNQLQNVEENINLDLKKYDNNELFDRLIEDVNGFGWFQKRMWILSLLVSIVPACNHLSPLYLAYSPTHQCISSGIIYKFQSFDRSLFRNF